MDLFLFLLLFCLYENLLSQENKPRFAEADTSYVTKVEVTKIVNDYQIEILELKSQIVTLTQTVASTKESFYNSRIYLWTFIITVIGLTVAVLTFLGFRSISDRVGAMRDENKNALEKSEKDVGEIKKDLIQRLTEAKTDIKDALSNFRADRDKFEQEAHKKIERGLNRDLQNVIYKIMKESFSDELKELNEQVAELNKKYGDLRSNEGIPVDDKPERIVNSFDNKNTILSNINTKNNAFDE